ncbi:MAG: hypothetical protein JWN34_3019, partial [Bryobacterales bacterium]|nr:hypothetical protein [Bryobacterales bacterium]
RLTSLYAVMTGSEVIRADNSRELIRIAFDPLAERFEVANAATSQDRAFISDVAEIWKAGGNVFKVAGDYLAQLTAVRTLTTEETGRIQTAIGKLVTLSQHPFNALVLTADTDVATVAEVFVRINGQGAKLNQADFILTLMSVFWEEGRKNLESFSLAAAGPPDGKPSPKNHFIQPTPDQMLRVMVGLGLKRGKLDAVYSALRGRVPTTGVIDPARREAGFARLKAAHDATINVNRWHYFMSALPIAGYRSKRMITSELALLYAYTIFLVGVEEVGVELAVMRQAIAEFFFMAAMTSRYAWSGESRFEADLAALNHANGTGDFLTRLRRLSDLKLTDDFWSISLPDGLATSGGKTPTRLAYQASLVVLDAQVLFSPVKVAAALDPSVVGTKSVAEEHHLFPKAYLAKIGVTERKQFNQIANFALLEWPDNLKVGATAPRDYAPQLDALMSDRERFHHALPPVWWEMPYETFLEERGRRMAAVVRAAWNRLRGDLPPKPTSLTTAELIASGETEGVEFKSTLRTNLHTGQSDEKIQLAALKTLAAFLNAGGGTLLIGVGDDGLAIGLGGDGFVSEDKMSLHLVNLVRDRIGDLFVPYIHPDFLDHNGCRILSVRCERGPKPAFVKDGGTQRFFVRGANATTELIGQSVVDYTAHRFK